MKSIPELIDKLVQQRLKDIPEGYIEAAQFEMNKLAEEINDSFRQAGVDMPGPLVLTVKENHVVLADFAR